MAIESFENLNPRISDTAYVHPMALVIGDVTIGACSSVWPTCVVRGDVNSIRIGARTNIQDGSVLHVTQSGPFTGKGFGVSVGDGVTVGHRAVLHGCEIHDNVLIGMGAVVLDGSVVENHVVVGAGSVVPPGKHLESGYLWMGAPVKRVRPLSDAEKAFFDYSAQGYCELANRHIIDKQP
jgi:carbonic anhydrase/acetyltransferase-like protein (isoleucine patch superfamily)